MRISSIISEYNPFHEGHKYHMEKTKKITNSDYCIVIMSGDFTQRGTPAVIDKYARAKQALSAGADLVLELPVCFATASAEGFSFGAVSILEQLGVVDFLVFGSECGNVESLQKAADFLNQEPFQYQKQLQNFLRQGLSFPKARAKALHLFFPDFEENIFSSSNNILGIEYCRALSYFSSSITPMTITRKDNLYHDSKLAESGKFSSATAIRNELQDLFYNNCKHSSKLAATSDSFSSASGIEFNTLIPHMPSDSLEILKKKWGISVPIFSEDFSLILKYKLLMETSASLTKYMDVNSELADRICNTLNDYRDFDSFCNLLKTKELTYTRISRSLLHILLDIQKEKPMLQGNAMRTINTCTQLSNSHKFHGKPFGQYARILGFRKRASPLLHEIKQNTSIPLISKLSDAVRDLEGNALAMLQKDIQAAHIYESVVADKFGSEFRNEFQRQLVIL